MAFTGDIIHGWRIAKMKDGRRPMHGTGIAAWVDEPVVELVKGHRSIRAKGQQGIDPAMVLNRAITSALLDDIHQAQILGRSDEVSVLVQVFRKHEQYRKVCENGWTVERMKQNGNGAVFRAGTATSKGTTSGSH